MRIQVLSDFHVDVRPGYVPELAPGAELVIVAGDVCEGPHSAMAFLRAHIPQPTPIVYVAGNHEFYKCGLADERAAAAEHARGHGIIWLDDTVAVVGGVRFLGATLWTDFKLFGATSQQTSMQAAASFMMDYALIAVRETGQARIKPKDTVAMHVKSRAFLERALAKPYHGPTVVVTHHGPHPRSVAAEYADDPVTPAFTSNLEPLILKGAPALWVHGHTHTSFDYFVGSTRVICNPHGYGRENPAFDPALVVEVAGNSAG
jgi:Icc-related predicted phosphoesterase